MKHQKDFGLIQKMIKMTKCDICGNEIKDKVRRLDDLNVCWACDERARKDEDGG